jgi:hypothetical protein
MSSPVDDRRLLRHLLIGLSGATAILFGAINAHAEESATQSQHRDTVRIARHTR